MTGVRNPNTDDWTPARTEAVLRLKAEGKSAAEIAKTMGGTTRCAVIGKLQRLGFAKGAARDRTTDAMANSPNKGVKTKAMALDLSDPALLRPRRFSWEAEA